MKLNSIPVADGSLYITSEDIEGDLGHMRAELVNDTIARVRLNFRGDKWEMMVPAKPAKPVLLEEPPTFTPFSFDPPKKLPSELWTFYRKLVKQGFSGDQAMTLTRDWLEDHV